MPRVYLYTDGGCISSNPSKHGGTIAVCFVDKSHKKIKEYARLFTCHDLKIKQITNNQMELLAIIEGLKRTEDDMTLHVCSDSIVSLGRVFMGYAMTNVPDWMQEELRAQKRRLVHWGKFTWELIGGHPTQIDMRRGSNRKGHRVSGWNQWCDNKCSNMAQYYLDHLKEKRR